MVSIRRRLTGGDDGGFGNCIALPNYIKRGRAQLAILTSASKIYNPVRCKWPENL